MSFTHILPFIFTGGVILLFITQLIRKGGFKAAMFGAPITKTFGEVTGTGSKLMTVTLRVHRLENKDDGRAVGLEFVARSFASYQMFPMSLSKAEAASLVSLLQMALASS